MIKPQKGAIMRSLSSLRSGFRAAGDSARRKLEEQRIFSPSPEGLEEFILCPLAILHFASIEFCPQTARTDLKEMT